MDEKISTQDKIVNSMPIISLAILAVATIVAYFVL